MKKRLSRKHRDYLASVTVNRKYQSKIFETGKVPLISWCDGCDRIQDMAVDLFPETPNYYTFSSVLFSEDIDREGRMIDIGGSHPHTWVVVKYNNDKNFKKASQFMSRLVSEENERSANYWSTY